MFASASHEFRTPLNAIINSYDFIKKTHENVIDILIKQAVLNDSLQNKILAQNKIMLKFIKMGSKSSELL